MRCGNGACHSIDANVDRRKKMTGWFRGSFARAILLALLFISIIPIIFISALFINSSTKALTNQMEANLFMLAQSKAEEIDLRLQEVWDSTEIAARQAAHVMERESTSAEVAQKIIRYQPDQRNIVGLDLYYNSAGGEAALGNGLSNVYWNNDTPPTGKVLEDITNTEEMDVTFGSIKATNLDTQWIYLTTPEGMMRLFPWASNNQYPDDWDPREVIFYTVAEPANNPTLATRATPPYVDFAGAGWMVTVSTPIIGDNGTFMGIMSHDITIQSLRDVALDINVLNGAGYGFLIDSQGGAIAHPAYLNEDASKGTEETVNLATMGTVEYQSLIQQMMRGQTGQGYFLDDDGMKQLLVYAPIPSIGWSLGIAVPETAVVAPATDMRTRALGSMLILIAVAALVAVLLARQIHRPLSRLLQGVHAVAEERRPEEIQVESFVELTKLANAFNEMASRVWERESRLKKTVAELRIEIDANRSQKEVQEITETEYFRQLELNAERMRSNLRQSRSTPSQLTLGRESPAV